MPMCKTPLYACSKEITLLGRLRLRNCAFASACLLRAQPRHLFWCVPLAARSRASSGAPAHVRACPCAPAHRASALVVPVLFGTMESKSDSGAMRPRLGAGPRGTNATRHASRRVSTHPSGGPPGPTWPFSRRSMCSIAWARLNRRGATLLHALAASAPGGRLRGHRLGIAVPTARAPACHA